MQNLISVSRALRITGRLAAFLFIELAATTPSLHALTRETAEAIAARGIPRVDTYYPRETGVRGVVHKIAQLPNGDLGILTSVGVYTFDGTNWQHIPGIDWATNSGGLPDGKKVITYNKGAVELSSDHRGGYQVKNLTPPDKYTFNLPPLEKIAYARGFVFGQAGDKLVKIHPDGEIDYQKLPNWSNGCFSVGDELYFLGGSTSLLNKWDWDRKTLIDCTHLLDTAAIYEWMIDYTPRHEGGAWLMMDSQKIIGFDGQTTWAWPGNEAFAKRDTKAKCFLEIAPGALAIGTSSEGLLVFDDSGKLLFEYSKEQGLDDVSVLKMGLDAQNGLWIATEKSLTRLPERARTVVFDETHGLPEHVLCLAFFRDRIYAGTAVGLYESQPDPDAIGETFKLVVDQNDIGSLLVYEDHLFIAGSTARAMNLDGEVYDLRAGGVSNFFQPTDFPGVVLAGNFQGVLRLEKSGDRWSSVGQLAGPTVDIYSMAESAEGDIFGSLGDNRIARVELDESLGSFSVQDIPRSSSMWSSVVNIEGEIYVSGDTCLRWDPEKQTFVPAPQMQYYVGAVPFGFDQVYGTSDVNAFVAVNARSGIVLPRPSRQIIGDISSLGNAIDTRASCIAVDPFGNIWAGGSFGLVRSVPPSLKTPDTERIAPRFHRLVSVKDGETFPVTNEDGRPLILQPNQDSLRIEVEFPHFTAAMHNLYQIYVEGVDSEWPVYSNVPFRELTNLDPGNYVVYVNASDTAGQTFSAPGFYFTLRAPWYQRPWAYGLFSLVAILIVVGIVFIYNRAQIQRSRKLQQLVQQRTQEIQNKNKELEHQAAILERQNYELEEKTEELQSTTDSLTETLHQLHDMQDQLVATARTAGKAEIATNVLHNVGNVLNSINVSLTVLTEKVAESKVSKLSRLAKLVESHMHDIDNFLTQDKRGKSVPDYLIHISEALREEISVISYELNTMEEDVDHVKRIIAAQQTHAKSKSIKQDFYLRDLCDTALTILGREAFRSDFEFSSEIDEDIILYNDKHRVLEIVLNLVSNAQDAIHERRPDIGMITIKADVDESKGQIAISITDNGIGIDPQNQSQLFTHGFTTKAEGHGFGLHGSANAARALGGQLNITSPGVGKGATATLILPLETEAQAKAV